MLRLDPRQMPSTMMKLVSPLIAAMLMLGTGFLLFMLLGKDPVQALYLFFIDPLSNRYGIGEWLLKATPLTLCAIGLVIGFRAGAWNIGAEGQLIIGALAAGGVALFLPVAPGFLQIMLALAAGMLGGLLWAAIPAFLRIRFHTNEILVSLMLVYVAGLLLLYFVNGPWKDPDGFNFPQSAMFEPDVMLPLLTDDMRVNLAFPAAILLAFIAWIFCYRTIAGYRMQVNGMAPGAAGCAGFEQKITIWLALMISGASL